MYGVVEIGGHQYKVSAGDLIDVEKLSNEAGSTVDFENVMFIGGDNPAVGMPVVGGAKVTAKIIRHDKSRKVLVFKRSPGSWRKRKGHRQQYTSLLITKVDDGNGNSSEIDKKSTRAEKYLK